MTAVTVPARGGRPHGLTWAMLRLHRSALWFWVLLVTVAAGALLWAYYPSAYYAVEEYRRLNCPWPGSDVYCDSTGPAYQRYSTLMDVGGGLITLVPILTAAWAGGALIGRDLENGTARLAWTQSVTPARWLAAKLAVPAALLVSGTTVLALLHRLALTAEGPELRELGWHDVYANSSYLATGTLAPAYALLGLAVGALAGLLLGRSLPGLATGALGLLVLSSALSTLRPHLWPVRTLIGRSGYPEQPGMLVDEGALTSTGARVKDPLCRDDLSCLTEHDVTGFYRDYHPPAHFWPLQLTETAIVLALTALTAVAAFHLLKRRTP
ncbi:ABC transporter permease [Streptomyces sp. NPDC059861]|uniref:ABC transporter permease n=1 Tax=Streptomyces sp. NPDC059861 TaxID=3346974 RepID=UPI003646F27A